MQVLILDTRGDAALAEWRDASGVHRAYVPLAALSDLAAGVAQAEYETLAAGIPYGEPWELLPIGRVGADRIARELRERGLWSREDLRRDLAGARAALQAAYGEDLKILIDATRNERTLLGSPSGETGKVAS